MNEIKFCKDCKFYKYKLFDKFHHYCIYSTDEIYNYNVITGKKNVIINKCDVTRGDYGICGKEGKLFEPKNDLKVEDILHQKMTEK